MIGARHAVAAVGVAVVLATACASSITLRDGELAAPAPTAPATPTVVAAVTPPPPTAAPTAQPAPVPVTTLPGTFRNDDCDFAALAGLDHEAECGWLVRPALDDDLEDFELPVVIFRATGDAPSADPVFFLHGGPAAGVTTEINLRYDTLVAPFAAQRDVVFFDQRGSGSAKPELLCQLEDGGSGTWASLTDDELLQAVRRRAATCARRAVDSDIALDEFSVRQGADDIAVLARELGYPTVNLIGTSWGGRLAQTAMSRHPEVIRSSVLNSPLSVDTDLVTSMPSSLLESLSALDEACALDTACVTNGGDIVNRYAQLVDQLDREPLNIQLTSAFAFRNGATTYDVAFDGEALAGLVFSMMYSPTAAASLPDLITDLEEGDTRLASHMAGSFGIGWIWDFGFLVYMCNDSVPWSSPESVERQNTGIDAFDRIDDPPDGRGHTSFEVCDHIDLTPDVGDEAPYDVPTLVLAGKLDPITAYSTGRQLAEALPRGRFLGIEYESHGVLADWCARRVTVDFLDQPDVPISSACSAGDDVLQLANGAFTVNPPAQSPAAAEQQVLVDGRTVTLLVPESYAWDWREKGATWWRDHWPEDATSLSVYVGTDRDDVAAIVELRAAELDARSTDTTELDGWDETTYASTWGIQIIAAINADNIAVMVQGYPDEIDALREALLEPAKAQLTIEELGDD